MFSIHKGNVRHQDLSFAVPGDGGGVEGAEIIIDNEDAGVTYIGEWNLSTNSNGYGPTYHWAETSESEVREATYRPALPAAGRYRVDTWYYESWNRAPDAPFTVSDGENEETVNVNQLEVGRQWVTLAEEIYLDPAKEPFVRLNNDATNNVVIADAVRWTVLDAPPPEPDLDFEVTIEVDGPGRIEGAPEDGVASHGTILELEAIGQGGSRFLHWDGNAWGQENPISISVGDDLVVKAVFQPGYEVWLEENYSEEERSDPEKIAAGADPFGHGISNLLKFAFGMDGRSPDRALLPAVSTDGDELRFTFRRRADAPDLEYRVEISTNLSDWETGPGGADVLSVEEDGEGFEKVTVGIEKSDDTRAFIRLGVSEN